jgi:hypothetical protein
LGTGARQKSGIIRRADIGITQMLEHKQTGRAVKRQSSGTAHTVCNKYGIPIFVHQFRLHIVPNIHCGLL